jgi:hypothetical protein
MVQFVLVGRVVLRSVVTWKSTLFNRTSDVMAGYPQLQGIPSQLGASALNTMMVPSCSLGNRLTRQISTYVEMKLSIGIDHT